MEASNTFEVAADTSADETNVSTTNSDDHTAGTAFTSVTIGTGVTVKYDTAQAMHGSYSVRHATGGTSAQGLMTWGSAVIGTPARLYGRFYLRMSAIGTARPIYRVRANGASTQVLRVQVSATGAIELRNSGNTVVATTTATISASTWYRIEVDARAGASITNTVRLYAGDSTTLIEEISALSNYSGNSTVDEVALGNAANATNLPNAWYDSFKVSDAAWVGPEVTSNAPTPDWTQATATAGAAKTVSKSLTGVAAGTVLAVAAIHNTDATGTDHTITLSNTGAATLTWITPTGSEWGKHIDAGAQLGAIKVAYARVTVTGDYTIITTATGANSANGCALRVVPVTGVGYDNNAVTAHGSSTTTLSIPITPALADSAVLVWTMDYGTQGNPTYGSGWTRQVGGGVGAIDYSFGHRTTPPTDTSEITFTTTAPTSLTKYNAILLALPPVGGTQIITGTRASERNSAAAGVGSKSVTAGRATDAEVARPGSGSKTVTAGRAVEADVARAGSGEVAAGLATLVDDFNDNTIDTGKWPGNYNVTSEIGGRARVGAESTWSGYASATTYRLASSQIHLRMIPPAPAGATVTAYASLIVTSDTSGSDAAIIVDTVSSGAGAYISFALRVGFSDPDAVIIPYDASDHAWLRIREAGGTVHFETSPDADTWTTRYTADTPAWAAENVSGVVLEAYRNNGTANYAEYDSVNAVPPDPTVVNAGRASEQDEARVGSGSKNATAGRGVEVDVALAGAGQGAVVAGRASEQDQARAGTGTKTGVAGRGEQDDVGRAGTGTKSATAGRAAEIDQAYAGAGGQIITAGRAEQVDTALSGAGSKSSAATRGIETDVARAGAGSKTVTAGRAAEADAASSGAGGKAGTAGRAIEVDQARQGGQILISGRGVDLDVARAGTGAKVATAGRAADVEQAYAGTGAKAITAGRASDVEVASSGAGAKDTVAGRAETDEVARPGAGPGIMHGARATSPELGRAGAGFKAGVAGQAIEVDVARSGAGQVTVQAGRAEHVDQAYAGTGTKAGIAGRGVDVDAGRAGTGGKTSTGGPATEVDVAREGFGGQVLVAGRAVQVDAGRAGTGAKAGIAGRAAQVEVAQPGTGLKTVPAGRAGEVEQARAGSLVFGLVAGRAVQVDVARAGIGTKTATAGVAGSWEVSRAGVGVKTVTAGRATEVDLAYAGASTRFGAAGRAEERELSLAGVGAKAAAAGRASTAEHGRAGSTARLRPTRGETWTGSTAAATRVGSTTTAARTGSTTKGVRLL